MNSTRTFGRLGLALAALISYPAVAAPTFTGNAATDFAIPGAMTFSDPGNIDVGVPVAFPSGTISGWDMENVSVFYDAATDRLYMGIDTYNIAGDADNDGNPGATSSILSTLGGVDLADLSGTEGFAAYFDVDQDGTFDAIAGVSGTTNAAGFTVARFAGSEFAPSFAFGAPMAGVSGSLFGSPSASAPHLEFVINNFSQIAPSSGADAAQTFAFRAFLGSLSDGGIGEDFFPAVTESKIIDVFECGDGRLDVGEQCDDGNLTNGDGCDATCIVEACGDGVIQPGETCDDGNRDNGDGCDNDCNPSAFEICDDLDNDGDGLIDEGLPSVGQTYHWETNAIVDAPGGRHEHTAMTFDNVANTLSFTTTIKHSGPADKTNAFWMAVNNGPNPKGNAELALFYFDRTDPANPKLSVYAYNGANADTSWYDGNSAPGTQAPDPIHSSEIDPSFIHAISVTDDGVRTTMSFTVDVTGINNHIPTYSAAWPWLGAQYDTQLGLWFHWVRNASISYTGGWISAWSWVAQGWLDLTGQLTTTTEVCEEVCGNGGVEPGEACDDGNTLGGDGCSASCEIEFCGDGTTSPVLGEDCDDGNTVAGDGCSPTCQDEFCGDGVTSPGLGESCDDGNNASGDGCNAACDLEFCGDGVLTAALGEACDDGNNVSGDGCSATCDDEFCGDGMVSGGEACDDGNNVSGDGCSASCNVESCGDGVVSGSESCDDGNTISGDGCSSTCTIEACGDGMVGAGEACDDGNTTSGDGCSASCQLEGCGDGLIQPGETCDDGNRTSGDGCDATCQTELCALDLGAAETFNVFVQNNYWGGLDVGGAVAVGNQIDMMNFSINHQNPGGVGVVAGNVLWLGTGTVHGDAIYGNFALVLDDVDVRGSLLQASPIDFGAEFAYLESLSDSLAARPDNGLVNLGLQPWGNEIVLTGTSSALNVFTVPDHALADAQSLTINVPSGATVLINVTGTYVELANFGVFLNGATPERTLWNLPEATGLNIHDFGVQGTILANEAYTWFYNGSADGQLIVSGLEGTGEPHHRPFGGEVCP